MASTKQRALDDARDAHAAAVELCRRANQPPPAYRLTELIGKGSFGRVYKAVATTPATAAAAAATVVAVKVIDIEHGDGLAPGFADTLADLRAEVRALRALRDAPRGGVNRVVEALLVGAAVWLVMDYCAGGSVATLMRPTRGRGLRERWVIPVLRETAAALAWVHAQGVLHRDVKAANVLVAEDGGRVQLCDFGVAATLRSRGEKRTTVVGTPHWMAPELLGSCSSSSGMAGYGGEVDVWAFGALAYELAMGHPPNAALGMGLARLGKQLQMQSPRLPTTGADGQRFSEGLRDLVACCLQRDPARRPTMAQLPRDHAYIAAATEEAFPTQSLAQLVRAFRIWEAQGGDRRSLFAEGGAAAAMHAAADADDEDEDVMQDWNFGTMVGLDDAGNLNVSDHEALSGAYGISMDGLETQPTPPPRRRQRRPPPPPPPQHRAVQSPLEKVFDSNTLSNYDDYARQYYAKFLPAPVQQALLHNGVTGGPDHRDSLIDLDLCLADSSSSLTLRPVDMGAVRPMGWEGPPPQSIGYSNAHRATQDWKFPVMFAPPALEGPQSHFSSPFRTVHDDAAGSDTSDSRAGSEDSLIDLDMSTAALDRTITQQQQHRQRHERPPTPPLPFAPLSLVMLGQAADEQVKEELHRMTTSLADHLRYATAYLADLPIRRVHAATSAI